LVISIELKQGPILYFLPQALPHPNNSTLYVCVYVWGRLIGFGEQMYADDVTTNKSLSSHGADAIESMCSGHRQLKILTHCNTGSLATAGYGTALGLLLIFALFKTVLLGVALEWKLIFN